MLDLTAKWPITPAPSWNVLDSTKLQAYCDCERKFFYEYVLGWRTKTANNHLTFGNALHQALEHIYKNSMAPSVIAQAYELFLTSYRKDFPEETDGIFEPKTPERAFLMLVDYAKQYSSDLHEYEILYTEVAGTVAITDYLNLSFKMDTILKEHSSGKMLSLEHKSSQGYYNGIWPIQWPLSIQVGTYTHALNCLFSPEETKGVIINGIFFHKTKKVEFSFKRQPVYKTNDQMQVWLDTVLSRYYAILGDFEMLQGASEGDPTLKAFPLNPRSCSDYFRPCIFHDFCQAWPNPLRKAFQPPLGFMIEHWNPLEEYHTIEMELK